MSRISVLLGSQPVQPALQVVECATYQVGDQVADHSAQNSDKQLAQKVFHVGSALRVGHAQILLSRLQQRPLGNFPDHCFRPKNHNFRVVSHSENPSRPANRQASPDGKGIGRFAPKSGSAPQPKLRVNHRPLLTRYSLSLQPVSGALSIEHKDVGSHFSKRRPADAVRPARAAVNQVRVPARLNLFSLLVADITPHKNPLGQWRPASQRTYPITNSHTTGPALAMNTPTYCKATGRRIGVCACPKCVPVPPPPKEPQP
jgi:hypothetical protein